MRAEVVLIAVLVAVMVVPTAELSGTHYVASLIRTAGHTAASTSLHSELKGTSSPFVDPERKVEQWNRFATSNTTNIGAVIDTLVLWNNTLVPGNFQPLFGFGAEKVVSDPNINELFVGNGEGDVTIVNGTTDTLAGFLPLSGNPLLFDPVNGQLYVARANYVLGVNPRTGAILGNITVGSSPDGAVLDPSNDNVYIANLDSYNVTVVNGSNDKSVVSILIGNSVTALAFDQANGYLYVSSCNPNCPSGPTSGRGNISVVDTVTNTVKTKTLVGDGPTGVAYDSDNGQIYVATRTNLTVVNATTDNVVGNVSFVSGLKGWGPVGVVYDGVSGDLYVPYWNGINGYQYNVSVVNGKSGALITSLPVGLVTLGIAFDASNANIYVSNDYSDNLSVIDGATNSIRDSIPTGVYPADIGYDPTNHQTYLAAGGLNITAINGTTNRVGARTNGAAGPIAINSQNGTVYVGEQGDITVIDSRTNTVTGHFGLPTPFVGIPTAIAYDGLNHCLYVAYFGLSDLAVVDTSTGSFVTSISMWSGGYDISYAPSNGDLYVTHYGTLSGSKWTNNVTVVDGSTNTVVASVPVGGASVAIAFDDVNGYLYVNNAMTGNTSVVDSSTNKVVTTIKTAGNEGGPSQVVADALNNYIYEASACGHGPSCSVVTVINGSTQTILGQVSLDLGPVGVAANSANGDIYVADGVSGAISVLSPSASSLPTISSFTVSPSPVAVGRTAYFNTSATGGIGGLRYAYVGLPPGCASSNMTGLPCVPTVAGSYTVRVYVNDTAYHSANATTTLAVVPAKKSTYAVTFTESGLSGGTSWSLTFNGTPGTSSTSSIVFNNLLNNTTGYAFTVGAVSGYTSSPSSGTVVVNGANVTQPITFTAIPTGAYSVTFIETGLPTGANWSVALGGKTLSSLGSTVTFTEKNGTYNYTVTAPTGYTATPPSGSFVVAGKVVGQSVTFTKSSSKVTYTVTFTEGGLPSSTSWSVTLNGSTESSTTATITFQESNGSCAFTVESVSGYTTSSSSGTIKVNGAAVSQPIFFTSSSSKGKTNQTTEFLGLPGDDGYIVIGVVVAVVAVAAALLLLKKRSPPAPAKSATKQEPETSKESENGEAEKQPSPEPERKA